MLIWLLVGSTKCDGMFITAYGMRVRMGEVGTMDEWIGEVGRMDEWVGRVGRMGE